MITTRGFARSCLDDLILAATLLTRVPMPPVRDGDSAALGRAVWAYPIIGALVGAVGAVVFAVLTVVGLPAGPASWASLAAMILTTGCFHEDGLADFWDGIGGGHTIERKLEIMRDSRIGSYGGAALILSLGLRSAAIAALADHGLAEAGLIVSGLLGRSAIAGVLLVLGPARADGLAATAADPPRGRAMLGVALSVISLVLLPIMSAIAAITAAGMAAAIMTRLMQRQIEGYTGDGLGATEQTVEMAAVLAMLAALPG